MADDELTRSLERDGIIVKTWNNDLVVFCFSQPEFFAWFIFVFVCKYQEPIKLNSNWWKFLIPTIMMKYFFAVIIIMAAQIVERKTFIPLKNICYYYSGKNS